MTGPGPVGYLPIATSVIALAFAAKLYVRYRERGGTHHVWWIIGMLTSVMIREDIFNAAILRDSLSR